MVKAIAEILRQSNKIALVAHVMPDGDTTGSCLALGHALKSMGKEVYLLCQDMIPYNLRFLDGAKQFLKELSQSDMDFDIIIALDCSDPERMGVFQELLGLGWQTINIDHHISNTNFAQINWVDAGAAATCELVYELIDSMDIPITNNISNALYTGLSTDTGNFSFSNTSSKTHNIAAKLVGLGVNPDEISNSVYKDNSLQRIKLIGKAIGTIEVYEDDQISTMEITNSMLSEVGASQEESSGMVDYAKDIRGVELALLFKEQEDGQIKVSMRSKRFVDCSALAEAFGGGGHARAAGCTINSTLDSAKIIILREAGKLFARGDSRCTEY